MSEGAQVLLWLWLLSSAGVACVAALLILLEVAEPGERRTTAAVFLTAFAWPLWLLVGAIWLVVGMVNIALGRDS